MSELITIPRADWHKMRQDIKEVLRLNKAEQYVNEVESARVLGIAQKTLKKWRTEKMKETNQPKLKKDEDYIEGDAGYFYNIPKLKGL